MSSQALRIAVEGCGHGTLDAIYASVQKSCEIRGWEGVDLLIICGDFQAVRTQQDLNVTAMPAKYRRMGDFHQYYYGTKLAPYLTVFVGGNHEASNHLFELYYGGWVAPNIYYLGAANVVKLGPLKIAAMSGIFKEHDYHKPHYERLPYSEGNLRSIYHQREIDVRKLLAYRSQTDIGLSHDWPYQIEWLGDYRVLFRRKSYFLEDALNGQLGSKAAALVMDRLRPSHWFSAHMHFKYAALKDHEKFNQSLVVQAQEQYRPRQEPRRILKRPNDAKEQEVPDTNSGSTSLRSKDPAIAAAVSGWTSFRNTVEEHDAVAYEREKQAEKEREEQFGKRTVADYNFEETFKEVNIAHDGNRQSRQGLSSESKPGPQIPQLDGACFSAPKRRRKSSPSDQAQASTRPAVGDQTDRAVEQEIAVTNPDAIDIDMSESGDDSSIKPILPLKNDGSARASAHVTNPDAIDLDMTDSEEENMDKRNQLQATDHKTTFQQDLGLHLPAGRSTKETASTDSSVAVNGDEIRANNQSRREKADREISEDVRAQLAAMSTTFAPEKKIEKTPDLPFPESITNKTTRFLALSKVEKGKDLEFLQLLEIEPLAANATAEELDRPLRLEYDPEWLAIVRAFASELSIGGAPNDKISPHWGDTYYRDQILKEEKWIQENVVEKSLLAVPENFEITTTADQQTEGHTQNDGKMPREQTNPQTAKFCELIGIENKFNFSEEDRDARMAAGPLGGGSDGHHGGFRNFSGGGRSRGGRGRGRGQGRGGRGRGRY